MLDKVNLNQVQNIHGEMPQAAGAASKQSCNNASCSTRIDFDALVEQAKQSPVADDAAVEEAKRLLNSGELESAENIQKAAENMIKFGI